METLNQNSTVRTRTVMIYDSCANFLSAELFLLCSLVGVRR